MSFGYESKGSFSTLKFLESLLHNDIYNVLHDAGRMGVDALSAATPEETGATAESWSYEIIKSNGSTTIQWLNDHVDADGVPIVIMLQYGHGTGTGGYVEGRDFINLAMRPIFDQISNDVAEAVSNL